MKKNIILLLIICTITLTFTAGCGDKDTIGTNVTTTVYPIEYLVRRLYGYNSQITSIYPNETNVKDFELTDKRIKDFSKNTTLFVYNGLTDEKQIAKTLINQNKDIQIIDASYSLKYTYGIEELWLNPNNYLMLANTIKNDLKDLSSSKYAAEKIEENFINLEEDLTTLDAELRSLGRNATKNNNNTLVIATNSLGFLEKYGFNIVNISNENNITSSIKNKFKNGTYKYIFVADDEEITDSVQDLVDNYKVKLIKINTMNTLTENERNNGDDYLTIMNDFITTLSSIVLEQ